MCIQQEYHFGNTFVYSKLTWYAKLQTNHWLMQLSKNFLQSFSLYVRCLFLEKWRASTCLIETGFRSKISTSSKTTILSNLFMHTKLVISYVNEIKILCLSRQNIFSLISPDGRMNRLISLQISGSIYWNQHWFTEPGLDKHIIPNKGAQISFTHRRQICTIILYGKFWLPPKNHEGGHQSFSY